MEEQSKKRPLLPLLIMGCIVLVGVGVIIATTALVPGELNPAYAAAIDFVNAAGKGDEAEAMSHLSPELKDYVSANCPDGQVSACVADYTPPEWGDFLSAVYRRAQPDGANAWDIVLISTYAEDQGFSGICIYNRAERVSDDEWQITRWAGWVSCDLRESGLNELANNADAPNRVPPGA